LRARNWFGSELLFSVVSSVVDSPECADIGAKCVFGAMAGEWSADVLLLIVQVFEFTSVASAGRWRRNMFIQPLAIGDRLPAKKACDGSHCPNP
jgi:hypothetical protein